MPYKNILLIDDDIEDTEFFTEAVEAVNKNVVCRTELNPSKAFEELAAAENLPDIIFLDYNMPAVNGLEFIKRMRNAEKLKNIEVIVMSTPPEEVMVQWFQKNNTTVKYISKPNTFQELKEILAELL
ncbi:response regulator [Flavobacterium hungaricum]|uniref:Response regulator n=1 Tax=Flavobacterium hungaricum TaxID=2082725 RepID=A0ABR9TM83_9FLAO|nr:response regulator [Flavobacterium hungaricum]MBE8726480.1 response regulator [Flavobacterium hungaricum]